MACLSLAAACAFDSDGAGMGGGSSTTDEGGDDEVGTTAASATTSTDQDETSGADSTTTSASDGDGSTTADTGEPTIGCPSPLPDGWIFCADFEAADASSAFSQWQVADGRMSIADGTGRSSSRALQFLHDTTDSWSGRAALDFGDNPLPTPYATERLAEVWVRAFVRTQAGWPDVGAGDLFGVEVRTEVESLMETPVEVSVYSNLGDLALSARPNRCFTGPMPGCGADPEYLDPVLGNAEIYASARADTWHCVVLHLRLDSVDGPGLVELVVDGAVDGSLDDYAFVDGWQERGWNHFRITGSWPEGVPDAPLHRWIDDVVIANAPLECG